MDWYANRPISFVESTPHKVTVSREFQWDSTETDSQPQGVLPSDFFSHVLLPLETSLSTFRNLSRAMGRDGRP